MNEPKSPWSWACVASFLIVACGGQSESDGSGGSGSGAAAGSGGATTGGSTGNGGSATGGGGSGGGVGGVGVGGSGAGGTPGSGGAPCATLEKVYDETLAKTKVCNPAINKNQCMLSVANELACPCFGTYVNEDSPDVATLKQLESAWSSQGCGEGVGCPLVDCAQPMAGGCVADSVGSGTCEDLYGK